MFSITIKVSTSRDESCNPFTLTERHEYTERDIEIETVQSFVKARVTSAREHFLEMYPGTQGKPSSTMLLPTDVTMLPMARVEGVGV